MYVFYVRVEYADYGADLLQPCHVTTLIYLIVLFSTDNYRRAYKIFNVSMHWGYFPLLAVIFPDTADLDLFFEKEMFWIHHWVLLFYPLYSIWSNRFPLDRHNSYYFWLAMGFNGFMHYLVQTPAGFISGVNVECMYSVTFLFFFYASLSVYCRHALAAAEASSLYGQSILEVRQSRCRFFSSPCMQSLGNSVVLYVDSDLGICSAYADQFDQAAAARQNMSQSFCFDIGGLV